MELSDSRVKWIAKKYLETNGEVVMTLTVTSMPGPSPWGESDWWVVAAALGGGRHKRITIDDETGEIASGEED